MATLKICGITRAQDWLDCERLGVDYIGLNFWAGSKRFLSIDRLRALRDEVEAKRASGRVGATALRVVGLFVDPEVSWVQEVRAQIHLDCIQLHGERGPEDYPAWEYAKKEAGAELGLSRENLAAGECPQVWVIRGTPELRELKWPQRRIDHVLLDAKVEGYGGQGAKGDWAWARAFVEAHPERSVWLAGGIGPHNAQEALQRVGCAGLDVASGAERSGAKSGEKDPDKIAALVQFCRDAAP